MIEMLTGGGLAALLAGGLMGYGELRGKVIAQAKSFEDLLRVLRSDIQRIDDRVADLTDFLLRERRGEDPNQIGRRA